jgi:hypothetical protein
MKEKVSFVFIATPQFLYQRPYDPVVVPMQNQQVAIANAPLVALSQPSYAPSRVLPSPVGTQPHGPNMFRHALLRVRSTILRFNINLLS